MPLNLFALGIFFMGHKTMTKSIYSNFQKHIYSAGFAMPGKFSISCIRFHFELLIRPTFMLKNVISRKYQGYTHEYDENFSLILSLNVLAIILLRFIIEQLMAFNRSICIQKGFDCFHGSCIVLSSRQQ